MDSSADLLQMPEGGVISPMVDLVIRARAYARQTSAESTRQGYAKDWADFVVWCGQAGMQALPAAPETVALFLTDRAERLAVATLNRKLAAVSTIHRWSGYHLDAGHAAVRDVIRGIRRVHGAPQRRVAPTTTKAVQAMATACEPSLAGQRDRALILCGFASALRRSELVALDLADISFEPDGVRISISRSKTDQLGSGQQVGIVRTGSPFCPVVALQTWLLSAGISCGAVFRRVRRGDVVGDRLSAQSVALIVKRLAGQVGLNPATVAGHSLRAGLATAAALCGVEERLIAKQTRHTGLTVRRYIRDGNLFTENVSGRVGL